MEAVVHRAVNQLLAADGTEALDVRVPVACAGLEMLGWALLQRHGWVEADILRRMDAAAITRLLLSWAGIPACIPDGFASLARRQDSGGSERGPEVVFAIRNRLLHPPKRLDSPEWPGAQDLREAWQLATWYLELVLLRVLGYDGDYWCRLRPGRYGADVEPVPWAVSRLPDPGTSDRPVTPA